MHLHKPKNEKLKQDVLQRIFTKTYTILFGCGSNQFKQTFKSLWRHPHVSKRFEMITEKVSEAENQTMIKINFRIK